MVTRKHVQGSLIMGMMVGIMPLMPSCAHHGGSGTSALETTPPRSVMLGVRMGKPGTQLARTMNLDPGKTTIINHVAPDTPAMRGGLEPWDLVISVNGSNDASPSAIRQVLREALPGEVIDFEIMRKGDRRNVEIILEQADLSRMSSATAEGGRR
jgi:S1-C subfamily serine protease